MTIIVPIESIISKIIFLRGEKVLLDQYLAELYNVETKQLKRAVRRNIKRFPLDFMFQLTKEEYQSLRSQFGTLKRGVHSKYPPDKPRKKIGFTVKEKVSKYEKKKQVSRKDNG
ncbi:MAG: ORF6N domain-containing protein [Candidatus Desulfaltia sp.]|nr:ORF6N domain-containing protein [Candidatus Desulfaltia sp.]